MAPLLHHLLLLSILLPLCTAATDSIGQYCSKSFNNTQIQSAIDRVLSDLVAKASGKGFATASSGKGGYDEVYGLAQCRGDVGAKDCATCLKGAAKKLPAVCPGQADARIWYDYCFMRYDDEDFVGQADTGYAIIYYNVENAANPDAFVKEVAALMGQVEGEAVAPVNRRRYGAAKTEFTQNTTIYGLAQCTRDLSPPACEQCLSSALDKFPDYCKSSVGCQVLYSSCIVRYEIYPFFFPLNSSPSRAGRYHKSIFYP